MNRNLHLLTWFNFFLDFRPNSAFAIIYFFQITHSYALALSVFSITMISAAVFEVPTGVLSDRIGRKQTIILGTLAGIMATILAAIGGTYWILVVSGIFAGLAQALFSGNNDAFLHDVLKETDRVHTFADKLGKVRTMFQIALAISAVLGGLIADWSLYWVMWVSVIPQVVCWCISLFMVEPNIHDKTINPNIFSHLKESITLFVRNPKLRLLSLGTTLSYGIGETIFQFFPVFIGLVWPVWAIGLFRFLDNGFAAIGFWFSGKLIKKFKPVSSLIINKCLEAALAIPAVLFPSVLSPILISLTSVLFGWDSVARDSLMHKEFTHEQRATMASLNAFIGSIFMGVFAVLFGWIADVIGPIKVLVIGNVLVFLVIVFYIRLRQYYHSETTF